MARIQFTTDVVIHGDVGPNGHEARTSFRAGEAIDCEESTARHFESRGKAVFVESPPATKRVTKPATEPVVAPPVEVPVADGGDEDDNDPADAPEADADPAADEPVKRKRGRPRKNPE